MSCNLLGLDTHLITHLLTYYVPVDDTTRRDTMAGPIVLELMDAAMLELWERKQKDITVRLEPTTEFSTQEQAAAMSRKQTWWVVLR